MVRLLNITDSKAAPPSLGRSQFRTGGDVASDTAIVQTLNLSQPTVQGPH